MKFQSKSHLWEFFEALKRSEKIPLFRGEINGEDERLKG